MFVVLDIYECGDFFCEKELSYLLDILLVTIFSKKNLIKYLEWNRKCITFALALKPRAVIKKSKQKAIFERFIKIKGTKKSIRRVIQ